MASGDGVGAGVCSVTVMIGFLAAEYKALCGSIVAATETPQYLFPNLKKNSKLYSEFLHSFTC